uniref:Uncharacterized protein n=1 Tax=Arundo donax TaxID=35708 RepID=A0A0A9B992_ARUDO
MKSDLNTAVNLGFRSRANMEISRQQRLQSYLNPN